MFDETKTYWSNNGKYQADYDRLVAAMPAMGNCDTTAGEMIRAASKLGYDFYNNGMGNNTSGCINFLDEQGVFDMDRTNIYGVIYAYTRGRVYNGRYNGDALHLAIEKMIDMTIELIRANPYLETQKNTLDMYEFGEPDQHFCDECGDETDRGYLCSYCEDAQYEEDDYNSVGSHHHY